MFAICNFRDIKVLQKSAQNMSLNGICKQAAVICKKSPVKQCKTQENVPEVVSWQQRQQNCTHLGNNKKLEFVSACGSNNKHKAQR